MSWYYKNGSTITTLTYNGNDLVKMTNYIDNQFNFILDFSKKGNKITANFRYSDEEEYEAELNSDGYPIKMGQGGENINTFQYLDGNVASIITTYDNRTFKYDDKKSPLYYCKTPKWFSIGVGQLFSLFAIKNNIIEWNYKHTHDGEIYERTTEYTYEYDNNDFPTKMYQDGKLIATFTY